MSVSEKDLRHVAALARLGLDENRVQVLVSELNGILAHMDALNAVNTTGVPPAVGVSASGMPLREDGGLPIPLATPRESYAVEMRQSLYIVPRLSTHESGPESPA